VRATLGYDQIAIYGGSYGTRLGQAYIRRYPDRVRSAVLDGVVPLDVNVLVTMAKSLERAIDRVVYADRKTGVAFTSLLERFDRGPIDATVMLSDGRPVPVRMSKQDFLYAVRGILYQPAAADRLPEWVRQSARTGRVDVFAQRYWQRARRMQATLAHGLHLSVDCAEDVPFSSEEEVRRQTEGTAIGRYLFDEYANACKLWPSTPVPADWRTPVTGSVPVLLLSGELDPATPPEFGERVARSLPLSRHIVVPGGAHGSAADCPLPAVLHVLKEGTLERLPDVCR
jgi:pimeloyl-ACP methyl ester carboxylesterase